jgi:asparagine synthetase B (glutamine-hydrolysing)
MNNALPTGPCGTAPKDVTSLSTALKRSLEIRIQRVRESVTLAKSSTTDINAEVAILFSGGLDCTILARLSHDLLPLTQSIDLLNVAFENPRVHSNLDPGISPYELCPDRITGRSAYAELMKVCPGRRWRFVAVNVPYHETVAHRSKVMQLMHPHNTEMDLSISYALYFASRGTGLVDVEDGLPSLVYSTPAHVLLSGFGADELFGGYQRHATAFARRGYAGLVAELELDYLRISMRNLGRDDRVISDSGKEVRFPYLDEDVVALTLGLPAWAKCDFANAQSTLSDQPAIFLEPAKRLLRLVAWELGMHSTAAEKKRAIQFGARTAKMESGKSKGTHMLT